ncbi:MAG: class I SAM-dependent methyltransferase [bacterium]|nr:class I SAM-dependent methyltransferase [bacterium]
MTDKLLQSDLNYFAMQRDKKNPVFWSRFPAIDFSGLKVLEIGCGYGSLCLDVAAAGARRVVGIDLENRWIDFAQKNLQLNYSQFKNTVQFETTPLDLLQEADFDIILSKAAFEHIVDLDQLLEQMKKRLKPGGKIHTGFGPLYNSPRGDHRRCQLKIPWAHALLPDSFVIGSLNKKLETPINSIEDLGLNGLSFKQYMVIFKSSGLEIEDLRFNVHENRFFSLGSRFMRNIPFLKEAFTFNIYCILAKRPANN